MRQSEEALAQLDVTREVNERFEGYWSRRPEAEYQGLTIKEKTMEENGEHMQELDTCEPAKRNRAVRKV
jgi:hypothetical protein